MVLAGASAAQTSTYWTLASSTGPSARQAEMTVVDTPRDRMILFGGKSTNADGTVVTNYDDTWAYSFATHTWTNLAPAGPKPPAGAGGHAIYDATRQRMVVFGSNRLVYALSLSGTPAWTQLTTAAGGTQDFLYGNAAAYDQPRDQVWLPDYGTTVWKYNLATNAWSMGPQSTGTLKQAKLLYDPSSQRIIAVGVYDLTTGNGGPLSTYGSAVSTLPVSQANPTWTYPTYSEFPWGTRQNFGLALDSAHGRVLLYAGVRVTGLSCTACSTPSGIFSDFTSVAFSDLWAMNLASGAWSTLTVSGGAPNSRGFSGFVYDAVRDEAVMFGGGVETSYPPLSWCSTTGPVCTFPHANSYFGDTWTLTLPDVRPPAPVTDLVMGMGKLNMGLSWTAPGDDGAVGTATQYDVRYSLAQITAANFNSALTIPMAPPNAAGTAECVLKYPLTPCTRYYVAVKTMDDAGNWSAISNLPSAVTKCTQNILVDCPGGLRNQPIGEETGAPMAMQLGAPQPNPGRGFARVSYGIPAASVGDDFEVAVYDVVGRRVATLASGMAQPGSYSVEWRASESGAGYEPGLYFVRFRLGEQTHTRTVTMLH